MLFVLSVLFHAITYVPFPTPTENGTVYFVHSPARPFTVIWYLVAATPLSPALSVALNEKVWLPVVKFFVPESCTYAGCPIVVVGAIVSM